MRGERAGRGRSSREGRGARSLFLAAAAAPARGAERVGRSKKSKEILFRGTAGALRLKLPCGITVTDAISNGLASLQQEECKSGAAICTFGWCL
jgi:hypothetical protein